WWPLRLVLNGAGAFKVRRGLGDREAIELALQLARDGHVVAMYPEGTRRAKGLVKKHTARPRSGAARIALEAGVPLVPAAVAGTDRLLVLGPFRIAYGAPVAIDDLRRSGDMRSASQEATVEQLEILPQVVASFGFLVAKAPGFEADDFLAAAAREWPGEVLVATSDRDAFQLASDRVTILQPTRGVSELARIGPAEVR